MDNRRTASTPGEARIDAAALGSACTECRRQLEPDWQFCAYCDTRLKTVCPRCAVPLPPAGSLHCGHCGLTLVPELCGNAPLE